MKHLFNKSRIQKLLMGLAIGVLSFGFVFFASQSRWMQMMEQKGLDFMFFLRGYRAADPRVFFIGIDDPSIKALGRWPWPRSNHAALLETLSEKPPAALGFDILFLQPQESDPKSDQALVNTSRLFDGLTFASYLSGRQASRESPGSWVSEVLVKNELELKNAKELSIREQEEIFIPFEELARSAKIGFINAPPDEDGSVRRVPLILKHAGKYYPSLALRLILDYYNLSGEAIEVMRGPLLRLHLQDRSIDIPLDSSGIYAVNFRSGLEHFCEARFTQVLKNRMDLSSKITVVGLTATGTADFAPTPLNPHTPLVMLHLNIIQNILQNDFLRILPRWMTFLGLLIILLGTGVVSYCARRLWAAVGSFVILCSLVYGNGMIFDRFNLVVPWVSCTIGVLMTYLVATTGRFWLVEKEKRSIRRAFQHYVSPGILEKALSDPRHLVLGGKRELLTVLFSDIRGFSTYCETRTPEEVVSLLNEYFTEMTQIIFEHGGTLDKYLGDGLMAIFGAPIPLEEDHALRAVRAAVQMQKRLEELREKWKGEGKEPVFIGVGINTGPMVAGNMGSSHVMNYTVIGDEVNLAARLEGLTRQFNVEVIISQATRNRIQGEWDTRSLGEVLVKGRVTPVSVYEVVEKRGIGDSSTIPADRGG